jgi:hypothetical protein
MQERQRRPPAVLTADRADVDTDFAAGQAKDQVAVAMKSNQVASC